MDEFASHENLSHVSDLLNDSRELSRIKRELYFQWRGNEIVDNYQVFFNCLKLILNLIKSVVNEVVFLCSRHLGEVVKMPPDCDVVLPLKKLVIFVQGNALVVYVNFKVIIYLSVLNLR